jgi:phosphatidylglycerol---prolipoprotein diacylglyceryl transferase
MIFVAPSINPIALSIGPLAIHWYGLAYLFTFVVALFWGKNRIQKRLGLPESAMEDLVFYVGTGVFLGGRCGYMLFYQLPDLLKKPWTLFYVWQGGMSFHGGLLGVAIASYLFAKKNKIALLQLSDFIMPIVPVGLGLGRVGNWINGELWGRATHASWGVVYPWVDARLRYPSQLIECFLEGFVLFFMLRWMSRTPKPTGFLTACFLITYAVFRVFAEFLRQPDSQLGYFFSGWLTMGQILSVPMIFYGIFLLYPIVKKVENKG